MPEKQCNSKVEVYSRVVGFYRPTSLWNKGKKEEYSKRKTYILPASQQDETGKREIS